MIFRQVKLGDVIIFKNGKAINDEKRNKNGKFSIYGSNGIIGKTNDVLVDGENIIIGRVGAYCGSLRYIDQPSWITDNAIYGICSEEVDDRYMYLLLTTLDLRNYAGGSAQPLLNQTVLKNISVDIPQKEIQTQIADILFNLLELLKLNLSINKTLEELALSLYNNWFVDFDPFQDTDFVESEFGLIPKELNIKRVDDLGNIVTGKTPSTKKSEFYNGKTPFIKIPDMHKNTFIVHTETTLSDEGANTQKNKMLPPLTVCVSCIATPGLVVLTTDFSQTNQQINSIICNDETSPYFTYLSMLYNSDKIISLGGGGTATLNLNKSDFSSMKLLVPNSETMIRFHQQVESIFEKIKLNSFINYKLKEVLDYLLPLLMRGEISILEAAERVREVISNGQPEPSI